MICRNYRSRIDEAEKSDVVIIPILNLSSKISFRFVHVCLLIIVRMLLGEEWGSSDHLILQEEDDWVRRIISVTEIIRFYDVISFIQNIFSDHLFLKSAFDSRSCNANGDIPKVMNLSFCISLDLWKSERSLSEWKTSENFLLFIYSINSTFSLYHKINKILQIILDMNSSRDVDILLDQCEDYLIENDIMNLIKQSLHKLCVHQPDNPIHFLKQYFSGQQYDQVSFSILANLRLCWHLSFLYYSCKINDPHMYRIIFSILLIIWKTSISILYSKIVIIIYFMILYKGNTSVVQGVEYHILQEIA